MTFLDPDHFEAGRNLTKGSRKNGDEKILVEQLSQVQTSSVGGGGSATETLNVVGLKKSDELLSATQVVKGALGTALLTVAIASTDGKIDCEWTGNPGAGAVVKITVRRDVPKS